MKKFRFYIALFAAKIAQWGMKLLGRNATFLPGKIAVTISKDFLAHLTPPKTVIAVTGTNGKTTVSNLLTSVLRDNGYSVTNNSFGSNVQAGVVSALIEDSNFLGRAKKDIAVLEVDERSSLLIYPYLAPDYLVCNNLMRDSLKRNAHTEFISYIIDKALPEKTVLVLNGDDLIASSLGTKGQKKIFFGVEADKPKTTEINHIRDIVYCPNCGGELKWEYLRYNHIGRMYCEDCGLKSPNLDYSVINIDWENNVFEVKNGENISQFTLINDNIVNVYNFVGAISVLTEIGLDRESIAKGFSESKIVKTRFDEVNADGLKITLLMSKGQNPIATTRCFDYAAKAKSDKKAVIVIIDDKSDNTNDSENTCWLYDSDYSVLANDSVKQVIFGGPRYKDQYLRGLIAGISPEKLKVVADCRATADLVDLEECDAVYLLHDLYRPDDAEAIKNRLIMRKKEGK